MTALITEAFNEAIKRLLNTANMLCEDDIPDSCLFLKFYKIRQRSLLGRPRSGEQIRKSEYLLLKNNYAYDANSIIKDIDTLIKHGHFIYCVHLGLYYIKDNTSFISVVFESSSSYSIPLFSVGIHTSSFNNKEKISVNNYVDSYVNRLISGQ